eukprot:m.171106 g.171106  ORF g.171106 m.171106 type:complete len:287 (+) comp31634_c0_seq1:105-965(+)
MEKTDKNVEMPPKYEEIQEDDVVPNTTVQVASPIISVLNEIACMKSRYTQQCEKRPVGSMVVSPATQKHVQSNVVLYVKFEYAKGFLTAGLLDLSFFDYEKIIGKANAWAKQRASSVNGTVIHNVEFSDNIQGLAVRYRTTPSRIRTLNKLGVNGDIFGKQSIVVPAGPENEPSQSVPDEQEDENENSNNPNSIAPPNPDISEFKGFVQASIFSSFQARTQLSDDECKAMLQMNNFDIARALEDYADVETWHKNVNKSVPKSLAEFKTQQRQRREIERQLRKKSPP